MVRDQRAVDEALATLTSAAHEPDTNLMSVLIDAVRTYATVEEIGDAMEAVFGRYVEQAIV